MYLPILLIKDVSWNTMIVGYWNQGHNEEALECYEETQKKSINPTVVCSLKACGSLRALYKGQEIHAQAILQWIERELFIGNTSVDMYAKCGCLQEVQGTHLGDVGSSLFSLYARSSRIHSPPPLLSLSLSLSLTHTHTHTEPAKRLEACAVNRLEAHALALFLKTVTAMQASKN
ncbi:hypothetical protein GOP47_0023173 [Adiantum capillus-veneris]|uniref:Uncharacterized protein n=1 Tax=Adiantum capillus-veneris TaxID=13818 RepID=A0A9D4Z610_ADICA|nr:hypothetical protein GOP47_0023173 [Adiantum capillus-veneris]